MRNVLQHKESHQIAIEYPNLFRHYVEGCKHTFESIQDLTNKGYQNVDSWPDEVAAVLRTDEIVLSSQVSKNLYVKHFDNYQIMHIVSKRFFSPLNDSFLSHLPIKLEDYYISCTILLDKDGNLAKNLEYSLPSIIFYRAEDVRNQRRSNIILDAFYIFEDRYYSFVDVEHIDHLSKYCFVFRDYNHKIMATASHHSESIESISLSNSTFYFNDKIYDHSLLAEIDNTLSGKHFASLLRGRASMTQRQLDLLAMSLF
jgi:hypothetical protein